MNKATYTPPPPPQPEPGPKLVLETDDLEVIAFIYAVCNKAYLTEGGSKASFARSRLFDTLYNAGIRMYGNNDQLGKIIREMYEGLNP